MDNQLICSAGVQDDMETVLLILEIPMDFLYLCLLLDRGRGCWLAEEEGVIRLLCGVLGTFLIHYPKHGSIQVSKTTKLLPLAFLIQRDRPTELLRSLSRAGKEFNSNGSSEHHTPSTTSIVLPEP